MFGCTLNSAAKVRRCSHLQLGLMSKTKKILSPQPCNQIPGLLQFVVPGSVRDAAANRCRSPASGSEDRLSGCAAHLEPEPATSSPCPLCRAGRWIVPRWVSMDCLSPEVLSARAGLEQAVPWKIAGFVAPGFRRRHAGILRAVSRSRRACSIPYVAPEFTEDRGG